MLNHSFWHSDMEPVGKHSQEFGKKEADQLTDCSPVELTQVEF